MGRVRLSVIVKSFLDCGKVAQAVTLVLASVRLLTVDDLRRIASMFNSSWDRYFEWVESECSRGFLLRKLAGDIVVINRDVVDACEDEVRISIGLLLSHGILNEKLVDELKMPKPKREITLRLDDTDFELVMNVLRLPEHVKKMLLQVLKRGEIMFLAGELRERRLKKVQVVDDDFDTVCICGVRGGKEESERDV